MLDEHRPAGAHAVRISRRRTRPPRRAWRRRSRRAQVSAVATILGLLIVVTFIASYISTTLPNTMGQNDLQHEVLIENQFSTFSALLQAVAQNGVVGAPVSQPVTLGSQGAPPFAGPDAATISQGNQSVGLNVNFTLVGPATYAPPSGAPLGGVQSGSGVCPKPTSTSFSFTGSCNAIWNFTGPPSTVFSFSQTGSGTVAVIVSTNSSTITVTGTGSGGNHYVFIGDHNTITMTGVGSGPTNVSVIGSYDSVTIGTVGSSPIQVYIYGNYDPVTITSTGSGPVKVVVYGTHDTFSVPNDTGSQKFVFYINGFDVNQPSSSLCPYANLSSTDPVNGFNETGSGSLTQYVNNSIGYYANSSGTGSCVGNPGCWAMHFQNVRLSACPFFSQLVVAIPASPIPPSAALVVHLANTYAPTAEVAFDQGAVVYAQPGGAPVFIVPPRLSFAHGILNIFVPRFANRVGAESGTGSAEVGARLLSVSQVVLPANGYSLQSGSRVTITVVTPYAAVWYSYLQGYSALAPYVTCSGSAHVCSANTLYYPGGALGTITIQVPTSGTTLQLLSALYQISIG